jgi:hypothetical protein
LDKPSRDFGTTNVEMLGVDGYIFDYSIRNDGREKIREALDYCRKEECIDNVVSYCQDCNKSDTHPGFDVWKIAERLYREEFGV